MIENNISEFSETFKKWRKANKKNKPGGGKAQLRTIRNKARELRRRKV